MKSRKIMLDKQEADRVFIFDLREKGLSEKDIQKELHKRERKINIRLDFSTSPIIGN